MYRSIHIPVDNSNYSNQAARIGVEIGKRFDSKLTGSHIYAAKMHDYRFKQMEYTLPDEYRQEDELERQRKIHDSLITMGLKLVSDCYLEDLDKRCKEAKLKFERKMIDGKHNVELVKDIEESDYDLTVMGVLGIGKMKDSQIGSVCERVTRETSKDVWIVKTLPKDSEKVSNRILVGIDGSPQCFGALATAIDLAKRFNKTIDLIGVYDPYLHYQVFNGIVDVLTDKAAKVFKFEEQNQLHEEVIDTGLAQIYQSHLNVAEHMCKEAGLEAGKILLDGKAFQKILDHTRKNPPWVLVIGRIGVHSEKSEKSLGSNTMNLLRLAPCDLLITTRLEYPELDLKAEESILWTPEAEERMKRVPELVKGIARTGILRLAVEEGHSVITNKVIDEAMDRFMPKYAGEKTEKLAEALAFERAKKGQAALCKRCGVTAAVENPVSCSVCGGKEFEKITSEMVDKIIASEGGAEEEQTYDGRKLSWTVEARKVLTVIKDMYQKRRAKARIEKHARLRKLDTVTAEVAREILKEEIGGLPLDQEAREALEAEGTSGSTDKKKKPELTRDEIERGISIVTHDAKGVALKSVFEWEKDAVTRILKVPSGFMRNKVQDRVEQIALNRRLLTIDLKLVEEGVEMGRKMMAEMLSQAGASPSSTDLNEVGVLQKIDKRRSELRT